jgi:hypothetical protein
VNGTLVTEVDEFEQIAQASSYLDVMFVFVQAVQSSSFDGAKMSSFGYGVQDFFADTPTLRRNDRVSEAAEIMKAVYRKGSKFKRGNPACRLYYVATGKWSGEDQNLEGRRKSVVADLLGTQLFSSVDYTAIGADGIHKLYRQAKNAIEREFTFANKAPMPEIPGVKDAYLGLVPADELLAILKDEDGEITKSIFYDNVRDWLGEGGVNEEIASTLKSADRARFALMNNGITIIARHMQPTGNKLHIEDFQIVNGCQTSHVLFEVARDTSLASVMVPLRVIATQDEEITNAIIRATNMQTQVKEEQFFSLTEFPRKLETFFGTFHAGRRLFYERRARQYDSQDIERTRIVTQAMLTRSFAAMFLGEPHRTARNYGIIRDRIGTDVFNRGHKLYPYYTAAYAFYRLEQMFRAHKVDTHKKPARYHILYALRLLQPDNLPQFSSAQVDKYCEDLLEKLWDPQKGEIALYRAVAAVDKAAAGSYGRDSIRTQTFTEKVAEACGRRKNGAPS